MIDRNDLLRRTDLAALLDEPSPAPQTRLGSSARWRRIDAGHDDQHPSITTFVDGRGVRQWKCWSRGHEGTTINALLIARDGAIVGALAALAHRAERTQVHPFTHAFMADFHPSRDEDGPDAALLDYVAACERILWHPPTERSSTAWSTNED